jgi:hypothetical protein
VLKVWNGSSASSSGGDPIDAALRRQLLEVLAYVISTLMLEDRHRGRSKAVQTWSCAVTAKTLIDNHKTRPSGKAAISAAIKVWPGMTEKNHKAIEKALQKLNRGEKIGILIRDELIEKAGNRLPYKIRK